MQGFCHPIAPQTVPPWAGHQALLSLRSLLRAVITAQTHAFHEHSASQCFSGSDFIESETFKQDLVVFIYLSQCFLILDNTHAAVEC